MINIRERKYEIGVLRTIGMKKIKVALQFVCELLIVCIISLMIGGIIGSLSSVKVSNMLLANEIENTNSQYEDISKNFGMHNHINETISEDETKDKKEDNESSSTNSSENKTTEGTIQENTQSEETKPEDKYDFGVANINEVNSIDAVVDFKVLLELLGIGIGLTLISSFATMIAISRFSPLTILKERS